MIFSFYNGEEQVLQKPLLFGHFPFFFPFSFIITFGFSFVVGALKHIVLLTCFKTESLKNTVGGVEVY